MSKETMLMPEEDVLIDLADLFKVFGDSTRIRILFLLSGQEISVQNIAEKLNMSQSAISHQLKILKQYNAFIFSFMQKSYFLLI